MFIHVIFCGSSEQQTKLCRVFRLGGLNVNDILKEHCQKMGLIRHHEKVVPNVKLFSRLVEQKHYHEQDPLVSVLDDLHLDYLVLLLEKRRYNLVERLLGQPHHHNNVGPD